MYTLFFSAALWIVFSCHQAQAFGEWNHLLLTADNGTQIKVDFTLSAPTGGYLKNNALWVNVYPAHFSPDQHIRAVLLNMMGEQIIETIFVDLTLAPDGDYYTGQAQANANLGAGFATNLAYGTHQEIAVVVDGDWQQNTKTGNHHFAFRMAECMPHSAPNLPLEYPVSCGA